ncbi:hypothetical protein [Paraburkholderia phytofirmans]|nr:hypothetical protein [Paraburkholderia phytofirmans]
MSIRGSHDGQPIGALGQTFGFGAGARPAPEQRIAPADVASPGFAS